MQCSWCGRKLGKDHGYDENGMPICASYSAAPNKAYAACKARAHRLRQKEAKGLSSRDMSEKREIEASSAVVEHLTDGIQIMINQLGELISLQRQQLAQPKQVVTETKVISTTTFSEPNFDDMDFDVEIKQDTSTKSASNFLEQMKAMQAGEGIWANKPKDVRQ